MTRQSLALIVITAIGTAAGMQTLGCGGAARSARSIAAEKVYVPPGEVAFVIIQTEDK